MLTADCQPITVAPGLSRLFLDYCSGEAGAKPFYAQLAEGGAWQGGPPRAAHRAELARLLAGQNGSAAAGPALEALSQGAGTVVTGQQVGLLGGPLFTPFKAATAIARARQASAAGLPHVAVFWLASEDHDFAEVNHVTFPGRGGLRKLVYGGAPQAARPVGGIAFDDSIVALVGEAAELLGYSEASELLEASYRPGRTFSQAFAEFYAGVFSAQGLLVIDAEGREFHRLGAPVLRAAIERADELHAALLARNRALEAAGYHAQVAVGDRSSLLFLIDGRTGARVALRRTPPNAKEPAGLWQAGRESLSTDELVGILAAEPERVSPSALLRPVFQDYLLSTSATVGGPAEIAYFAQSAVLFERILGRVTPVLPRFSATLVEPSVGELLRRHELTVERVFTLNGPGLAQLLAARAMPVEGKKLIAKTGNALEAELLPLLEWMQTVDAGLGRSAATAASKMRYQMNRLRNLAANFQLHKETILGRHAETISEALFPEGTLQERVHGAAWYFARFGFELSEDMARQALNSCPGHTVLWL